MAEYAIGIDLGTSNSCVAVARQDKVEVLPNRYGENTTASVVAYTEDGSVTVGNGAKANIIHDPLNTVSSAKRLIGRYFFSAEVARAQSVCSYEITEGPNHDVRIRVQGGEHSLPEVSAMVLAEMKHVAEESLGEPVTQAVITVPAYFNDNQRQATKDAGKIAGLEVLRILNEPTAAALAYGFGRGLEQRVAVYDLGGGTFDISVLQIGQDIFEVLATCGDTFLGGDDFDDRIIDLLADEFVAKEGINLRNDPFALQKLKAEAERIKMGLSEEETVQVDIPNVLNGPDGQPRSIQRSVSRSELAALVQDLVMRSLKVCDEAIHQAGLTVRDLDGVILVGGPTRLPLVRQAVADYFQQEPQSNVDPDEVVAMGAAIHAASLSNATQDSFLLDVTPLDLRIGVAGGLAETVIERNTPVPIEQTRNFMTFQDFQESVRIRVYQGDDQHAEANQMLGEFEFSGFENERRGEVSIAVTFEINADGIVNVTATDPKTDQRASTCITLSSGLSDSELDDLISQDPAARMRSASGSGESSDDPARPAPDPVATGEEGFRAPAASEDLMVDLFAGDLEDSANGEAVDELEIDDGALVELIGDGLAVEGDTASAMTSPAAALDDRKAPDGSAPSLIGDDETEEELFDRSGKSLTSPNEDS